MAPPSNESKKEKKSLVNLTEEFVELLNASSKRELDLDKAATHLKARKRRIYDITNVLEGIGLLQKTSKGVTRWVDCPRDNPMAAPTPPSYNDMNTIRKVHPSVDEVVKDLETLKRTYQLLDEGVNDLQANMRQQLNAEGAYVTYHDIKSIFNDQIAIAVKGPPGTRLEVNDQLQILVKSENGEIEAYLCPQFTNNSSTNSTQQQLQQQNGCTHQTNTSPHLQQSQLNNSSNTQPIDSTPTNPTSIINTQQSYTGVSSDEGRGRSTMSTIDSQYYDPTSGVLNDDYYNDPTLSSALSGTMSDEEDPSRPLVLYEADMEPHYNFMLDENYTITSLYTEDNLGLY